ncbi:MAG: NnrS family protein [Xanthobacteraceae bacterium]
MKLATQNTAADPVRAAGGIPRLGPYAIPLLSYGFRPFFLGAAIWACLAMIGWVGLLTGRFTFASSYGAVAWHAHEFLFGYVSAVMTGFLLTAIPNWTGRLPLQGRPLLLLVMFWAAGRAGMLLTDVVGNVAAATADSAYLIAVTAIAAREVLAGKNRHNLKVVGLIGLIATANILFHAEVVLVGFPDYGIRLGIAGIITLIMLVGGRVTPSFTHNWLARRGDLHLPTPLGRFDFVSIGVTAFALLLWVVAPAWQGTGAALLVAAVLQAIRLSRWAGLWTWREPIVLILHIGYAFVPLGALALAISIMWPQLLPQTGAPHAWTTGAMGIMTLAIMTRATRGHTGHDIVSTPATNLIYAAIIVAALTRVVAPVSPGLTTELLYLSAATWILSFAAFLAAYGPTLLRAARR